MLAKRFRIGHHEHSFLPEDLERPPHASTYPHFDLFLLQTSVWELSTFLSPLEMVMYFSSSLTKSSSLGNSLFSISPWICAHLVSIAISVTRSKTVKTTYLFGNEHDGTAQEHVEVEPARCYVLVHEEQSWNTSSVLVQCEQDEPTEGEEEREPYHEGHEVEDYG
jgi:hypothetical protein